MRYFGLDTFAGDSVRPKSAYTSLMSLIIPKVTKHGQHAHSYPFDTQLFLPPRSQSFMPLNLNAWQLFDWIIHGSHNYSSNTFSAAGAETRGTGSFPPTAGGESPVLRRPRDLGTVRGGTEVSSEARGRTGPSLWPGTRGWSRSCSPGPRVGSTLTGTRTFRWRPRGQMFPRASRHLTRSS